MQETTAANRVNQLVAIRLEAGGEDGAEVGGRAGVPRLRLAPLQASLEALSPWNVLDRGYAIVQTASGAIVKRAADAPPGTPLDIRLRHDRLKATSG